MMRLLRIAGAFIVAALVTYTVAAVAATQFALQRIIDLGLPVGIGQRLSTTAYDFVGMAQLYLPILTVGLVVALLVAALLTRWWPSGRSVLLTCAGFASVVVANLTLNWVFDITPIAAARTNVGLLVQGLAGLLGGWIFARLTDRPSGKP